MDSVNMLCNTVSSSLGPSGTNSIISSTDLPTFITNDGVTIARNIESEDQEINAVLEILKEASIKTDELVGDGTTTTIVLLKSIMEKVNKMILGGITKYKIKNKLKEEEKEIINIINKISHIPNEREKLNIAITSSGSEEYGKIIYEVARKINNKNGINIVTGNSDKTKVIYYNGYKFDSVVASDYIFKNNNKIDLKKCNILITNNNISDIESISDIINECYINNKDLIILANEYDEYFIDNILSLNYDNNLNIILLKNPEYGVRKYIFIQDIIEISNAKKINEYYYGNIKGIKVNKEEVIICFDKDIKQYINKIDEELKEIKDEYDNNYYQKRKSMLENGLATIEIGGKTVTEIREIKMHFDDAINAIFSSYNGVSLGGGITYLEVSSKLNDNYILKDVLLSPFKTIISNAMLDYNIIKKEIEKSNYKKIYNIIKEKYEEINNTTVLDSTNVLISSLSSAISIANLLLTTNSLIINEKLNNINIEHDFNI